MFCKSKFYYWHYSVTLSYILLVRGSDCSVGCWSEDWGFKPRPNCPWARILALGPLSKALSLTVSCLTLCSEFKNASENEFTVLCCNVYVTHEDFSIGHGLHFIHLSSETSLSLSAFQWIQSQSQELRARGRNTPWSLQSITELGDQMKPTKTSRQHA